MNEFLTQIPKFVRDHPVFTAIGALISLISLVSTTISAIRGNLEVVFVIITVTIYLVGAICVAFVLLATKEEEVQQPKLGATATQRRSRYNNRTKIIWTILFILAVLIMTMLVLSSQSVRDTVKIAFVGTLTPTPIVEGRIGTGTTRLFVEPQPSNQIHVILNLYFYNFFITATPFSVETPIFITQPAPIPLVNATAANPSATPPVASQGSSEGAVSLYPKMIAVLECPQDGSVLGCNEQTRDIQVSGQQVEPAWEWYLDITSESAHGKFIIVRVYGASFKGERVSDTPLWQTSFPVVLQTPLLMLTQTQSVFDGQTQTAIALIPTDTPTATPTQLPPTFTPTPTDDATREAEIVFLTQVKLNADATGTAAAITSLPPTVSSDSVAQTATSLAVLLSGRGTPTQEGTSPLISRTPVGGLPTSTPASLPNTGLLDEIGVGNIFSLALIALGLVGLIVIARTMRSFIPK